MRSYLRNRKALAELPDDGARLDRMCELNVARQVINVANTTVVQEAGASNWSRLDLLHRQRQAQRPGPGCNNNPELRT